MGWVLIALQNTFHRLLHAESPEEGIVQTVGCGGDTDTNAAIAGALLGAAFGADSFPHQWVRDVSAGLFACQTEVASGPFALRLPAQVKPLLTVEPTRAGQTRLHLKSAS